jgi:hypothetical protein
MEVLCINDDKLPPGAELKEGKTYSVISEFSNNFDQKVYIIKGVTNEGRTKFGLPWVGYRADRFIPLTEQSISVKKKKQEPILN